MTDNYKKLINKLDAFIRKYYKNLIIRGIIYSVAALLLFFVTIALLEYFAHFGTIVRTTIFYVYLTISLIIIFRLIIFPLTKLYKIGKVISHKQAAEIIGNHFNNVQDRLLNTLQLKDLAGISKENTDLIKASIDQRIAQLNPVPFSNAIDLRGNRKYLKYAIPPLFLIIIFLLAAPSIITEPTTRIINHNTYFEPTAPFRFVIVNKELTAVQQDDFKVEVQIEGATTPDAVFINNSNIPYKMMKENIIHFTHTFRNLQKDLSFYFEANGVKSEEFTINVLPKPIVLNFETKLTYPDYVGKQNEVLENTGDLLIPEGTRVTWRFFTRDTDELDLIFGDSLYSLTNNHSNVFTHEARLYKSLQYSLSTKNKYLKNSDSLAYSISVIPDVYPSITVEEFTDSLYDNNLYFRGLIKDDYGFKSLVFYYNHHLTSDTSNAVGLIQVPLSIKANTNQQQFFHFFDFSTLNLLAGDEVEYYFEVWDNDGVNGSKSSRSQKMTFKTPSLEELKEQTETASEQIKDDMENALKDLKILQQDIDELTRKMFDKKTLNWQDKQQIQDMLTRQKSIEERLQNLQELNNEKLKNEEQISEKDAELLQKQEELKKMMDELLTDDMKKMIEEIQKLLEELDKDKVNEMMEQMKISNEDLSKEIDRSLELFKQLEFEQKLKEAIDQLKELSEKQDKLSEETKNTPKTDPKSDELKNKQDELNKEFEKIQKELDDLEKKNEALENPNEMDDTKPEQQEIEDMMNESSEQLEQKKNSKASEKQKGASQKMDDLSQKLQDMMDEMQMEQMGEDIESLREILENLIQVSFDQENLMHALGEITTSNPKYEQVIEKQNNLKDDMKMIADSLYALSKRQTMIQPFINKEIASINRNIEKSIETMNERIESRKGKAIESQQYVMTSVNNLALLLNETLQQMMQQQMQMSGKGSKSCNKPGKPGGSSQMKSMQQLQQQLNQQLKEMREGQKPGEKPGSSGQKMSEQLARMAAQQAAIRKQMESFRDQLKEEGRGNDGNVAKMLEDMEKTEKDIVNKKITQETIERQQDILTRLLKSEKAERQREEEQRRESTEARDNKTSNPENFEQYNKIKNREVELLKTLPPNLNPFYKNKVSEYFYRFE